MKLKIISIALLCLTVITVSAQNKGGVKSNVEMSQSKSIEGVDVTEYEKMCKAELETKERLVKARQVILERKNRLKRDTIELHTSIRLKQSELARKQQQLDYLSKTGNTQLSGLLIIRKQSLDAINTLARDTSELVTVIDSINCLIGDYTDNLTELNSVRDEVCSQLLQEHSPYLDQKFAKMSLEHLKSIHQSCERFYDDESVREYIMKVSAYIEYKGMFDEATQTINMKYDKDKILSCSDNLTTIGIYDVNTDQMTEISEMVQSLGNYEAGILAFRDFIQDLNRRRDGNDSYGGRDFDDDLPRIMNQLKFDDNKRVENMNLKTRIQQFLTPVPYLKQTFDEYIEIIKAQPTAHPSIEIDILSINLN